MQLKRDTEYALRIIYSLANVPRGEERPVTDISRDTFLPKVIVSRLCGLLSDAGILVRKDTAKGNGAYSVSDGTLTCSLWDVVKTVEDQKSIFAVFDRESGMFKQCGPSLTAVDAEMECQLKALSIREMMTSDRKLGVQNECR